MMAIQDCQFFLCMKFLWWVGLIKRDGRVNTKEIFFFDLKMCITMQGL